MNLKKWMLNFLADLLDEWFVPIEDYRFVQERSELAEKHIQRYADHTARVLSVQFTKEWNDALYGKHDC